MTDETRSWRDRVGSIAREVGRGLDRGARALGVGVAVHYEIVPYRGFAGGTRVLVQARAQAAKNIPPAEATDSVWRNLFNTYKRIDADPLPHARVRVTIGDVVREVVADEEGFVRTWID